MPGLFERVYAFLFPEAQKVNPAYQGLIMYADTPQALTTPRNYKNFTREGFLNDTVFKCVSYIARNGSAIPPILYTSAKKQKRIERHRLLDLLAQPNSEQSGVSYREHCLAYKLLTGNNYQYAIRTNKNGPPDELWCLRPSDVEIIADKRKGVVGYKHAHMEQPIDSVNIGHTKYFNPEESVYGLSPIEVAALLIDMQTGTRKWDLALVQNSARPSGAWTVPTPLSKNDRDRLEEKLREKLSGYRNAGMPPVLDAGLKWQSMAHPPTELDWLESIKYNAVLIANIYNMPPQLVGDTSSSTYNNYEEAKAASYTEAIFPDLDDLYALWNNWLVPMFPDLKASGAYLSYDKESVEVVQRVVQSQKSAQAQRAITSFMNCGCTLNEARVLQGLPEVPEGKVYRLGQILIPADKLMEYAEQSLTTPVTAPTVTPEPLLEIPGTVPPAPTPASPPAPQKPGSPAGKGAIFEEDDVEARLADLREQGVTHIQWLANSLACPTCQENDKLIREVGKRFPSGHYVPIAHPHCKCEVVPVERKSYSNGYRPFMEAMLQ